MGVAVSRAVADSGLTAGFLVCLALAGCASDHNEAFEPAPRNGRLVESAELQSQVDQLLEETGVPGIVVALAEGGGEPVVAAAGFADIGKEIPLRSDTPFFIGSISKNLFAAIALQLVEEGLLALDDPLSAYLEWPRGDEITVRMLMNHSSGIPDYFGALGLSRLLTKSSFGHFS
jgi:CubicO group peptidase (beta-lactamase class C family)